MYIDGHEREDVVAYRQQFVTRLLTRYAPRMYTWDNNGVETKPLEFHSPDINGRFRLIPVTHDESTFYANNERKTRWIHESQKAAPERKGEGTLIMISDFLTSEWGRLTSADGTEDARVVFKAGKNRDGYFDADDLLAQVDKAIDIFEERTRGFATGLFLFDNAPSHQKRAPDGLSARKMPKNPNDGWTHHKGGPRMRPTTLADGIVQDFYFDDDHPQYPGYFKGILRERGLWPQSENLLAQCEGFKCETGKVDCCCRRLLFNQPDFTNQRSQLEELVTSRGHICDFYPKYHCELNFIEQYWGAVKFRYRGFGTRPSNVDEMQKRVLECLDDIPLLQIRRYANRSARFIDAYSKGLTGADAIWANQKYHGHRVLPASILAEVAGKKANSTSCRAI
ncbi:hypothetical protein L208DRAFT_413992 [Tricholoma matsutake]|nr:hypothetical protein L208DRAFT_413992 [Tricholoma matsutake 945]